MKVSWVGLPGAERRCRRQLRFPARAGDGLSVSAADCGNREALPGAEGDTAESMERINAAGVRSEKETSKQNKTKQEDSGDGAQVIFSSARKKSGIKFRSSNEKRAHGS